MTYYEELGVSQDATPDEIRRAYRALVKLLHPDWQSDEQLRQAAERQMRRLNEILSILTDERSRITYDNTLTSSTTKTTALLTAHEFPAIRDAGEWAARHWHLAFAGFVGVGLLVWYVSTSPPEEPPRHHAIQTIKAKVEPAPPIESAPPNVTPAPPPLPSPLVSQTKRQSPQTLVRRPKPSAESISAQKPIMLEPALPSPPVIVTASPLTTVSPVPEPSNTERQARTSDVRGTWLFVPGANTGRPKLRFQPSYIEMVITEDETELRGRYRGRYRTPDSPVQSEVTFAFQGKTGGMFHWTSGNGVQGEGNLKLLTAETIEVNWWTTIAPQEPPLLSGTAVLMRLRSR